jgi:hypothetical protein
MTELPRRCGHCQNEAMVDYDALASWPLDKIVTVHGYVCEKCGNREAVFHSTASFEDAMRKLKRYLPSHPKFAFLFAKAVRKAEGINRRGENYGARKRTDMATPG